MPEMSPRHRSAAHGFTLIELLAVIAIIGMLASLLMPALAKARQAAMTSKSMNNMRQIALAAYSYAIDHKNVMAFNQGDKHKEFIWESAYHPLLPYVSNEDSVFQAPADRGSLEDSTPMWQSFGTSYKMHGRAFSEYAKVRKWEKGAWKAEGKPKAAFERTLDHHDGGFDAKQFAEGKADSFEDLKAEHRVTSAYIQLASDLVEPWKELKFEQWYLRQPGHTAIPYDPQQYVVAFVAGNAQSFASKDEWELFRGKTPGGDDD
jgi:prepilin-type N-terminal cleavage/methylation domain-containing protein